jgi:type I restriction-modification system DNA methylase subunit/uncharacterized protein (DUF433 family)
MHLHGNILSAELISKLEQNQFEGQQSTDFGLTPQQKVRDEIAFAWSMAKDYWTIFNRKIERLPAHQSGTTETRKDWIVPLLRLLGYDLEPAKAEILHERSYAISHRAGHLDGLPVHIMGFTDELDKKRSDSGPRLSPHGLMQEYLNLTEHLYGIVTNGYQLRLLRDSGRIVNLNYVEFDLRQMLDEDRYPEFALLFRLLHATRMPRSQAEASHCLLERYHQLSLEEGNRVRENLRNAVESSLMALGNGFILHPSNDALRGQLENQHLSPQDYYRQLRRLVYRMLFLMVTEERDIIYPQPDEVVEAERSKLAKNRQLYYSFYSVSRLRKLSENPYLYEERYTDLWQGLLATFRLLEADGAGLPMGLAPLDGDLFNELALGVLNNSLISNKLLLDCIGSLHEFYDKDSGQKVKINYASLDVEELGSVYEGLLDLQPVIRLHELAHPFVFHAGTDRKTTGSYYTRPELVNELIKSALLPVIEQRLEIASPIREREEALLSLKICDTAAGSGHILLAAARTLAWYVARVRTNEDNPAPKAYRKALRDVIQRCIYGIDLNPDAVELCRLALWIEGHNSGKPLSFLEHKIKCGNSLVGIVNLKALDKGIPDDAYNPLTGDVREVALAYKKENKRFREQKQGTLFDTVVNDHPEQKEFANEYTEINQIAQDNIQEINRVREKYRSLRQNPVWFKDYVAANIYTSAFFYNYTDNYDNAAPTSAKLAAHDKNPAASHGQLVGKALAAAEENRFFHYPLEFPDLFDNTGTGGFDIIMGNPPWERIKLQEQEYFATRHADIANAPNKAAREKIIKNLPITHPDLYGEFQKALHTAEANSKFIRGCGRFPLTAVGDINTYSIFAELYLRLLAPNGRAAVIVPTGIATDDNNKAYFGHLITENRLVSLFDFENREAIFQDVHRSYKFCLLTVAGKSLAPNQAAQFAFFATRTTHLEDPQRVFSLTSDDFLRLNPNTRTCPIFRTRQDAELTAKIYRKFPILIKEATDQSPEENPWGIRFSAMFHMSNDSHLFRTLEELTHQGFELTGNRLIKDDKVFFPLYESKMIWHYDHRFGTFEGVNTRNEINTPTPEQYANPNFVAIPWYWVEEVEVYLATSQMPIPIKRAYKTQETNDLCAGLYLWLAAQYPLEDAEPYLKKALAYTSRTTLADLRKQLKNYTDFPLQPFEMTDIEDGLNDQLPYEVVFDLLKARSPKWLIGFRNVARSTDIRTFTSNFIPQSAVGHSMPVISLQQNSIASSCFIGNLSSIVFDFCCRQKLGGMNVTFGYVQQFPVLSPEIFQTQDLNFIVPRVLELSYTATDLRPFFEEIWQDADDELRVRITQQWEANSMATGRTEAFAEEDTAPFIWHEERRAQLRAELDAYYARLYGLTEHELRYILDPQSVMGEDFPGETFRVLKDKDIRRYGEYRTQRLILEAWERLENKKDVLLPTEKLLPKPMVEQSPFDGIYRIRNVAEITRLSEGKIRRWFRELYKEGYEGISANGRDDIDNYCISFYGMIELIVIGALRDKYKMSMQNILKARTDLANRTSKSYPFATNEIEKKLKPAGKKVIFRFEDGDITLDGSGQLNLDFVFDFFKNIEFDSNGFAQRYFPLSAKEPVVIDPHYLGGHAAIISKGIRVSIIKRMYSGPESEALLMEQYNLQPNEIKAALNYFNRTLPAAA